MTVIIPCVYNSNFRLLTSFAEAVSNNAAQEKINKLKVEEEATLLLVLPDQSIWSTPV